MLRRLKKSGTNTPSARKDDEYSVKEERNP